MISWKDLMKKNRKMKNVTDIIQQRLAALSDEKKARWLENYVKHDIRSRGVGIPQIREVIRTVVREKQLTEEPPEVQTSLLDDLMRQPFTEDKLAAILYLQLFWKDADPTPQLKLTSRWLDEGWISDWNVCDWLCVRVLTPLLDRAPEEIVPVVREWNADAYLWKARASLVPFAQSKRIVDHLAIIESFSNTLIQREERFCKTSVGWVLREYSKYDPAFVIRFLEAQVEWTTPEVVKNARKYIDQEK